MHYFKLINCYNVCKQGMKPACHRNIRLFFVRGKSVKIGLAYFRHLWPLTSCNGHRGVASQNGYHIRDLKIYSNWHIWLFSHSASRATWMSAQLTLVDSALCRVQADCAIGFFKERTHGVTRHIILNFTYRYCFKNSKIDVSVSVQKYIHPGSK